MAIELHSPTVYASVDGAPEAYGSHVCLSVHPSVFPSHILHNVWKLSAETGFTSKTQFSWKKYWTDFRFEGFVTDLWHDLLSLMAVTSNPESSKEHKQAAYQHDSSICTTNQMATRVKSRDWDCQSYTQPSFASLVPTPFSPPTAKRSGHQLANSWLW